MLVDDNREEHRMMIFGNDSRLVSRAVNRGKGHKAGRNPRTEGSRGFLYCHAVCVAEGLRAHAGLSYQAAHPLPSL